MMTRTLLIGACLLPLAPQPDAASRAIDLATSAYANIRTARASFEQTITNSLVGSALKSRGEFQQQRPDRFEFTFSEPKGDRIVSDGKFVWIFLPSSAPGQVIRSPVAADAAGSLDMVGEFFTNPKARYTVADGGSGTLDGRDIRIVILTPKTRDATFSKARVWIDVANGSLRQFEAQEPSGITRLVHILDFTPNAAVSKNAFLFQVPKGVRVIER